MSLFGSIAKGIVSIGSRILGGPVGTAVGVGAAILGATGPRKIFSAVSGAASGTIAAGKSLVLPGAGAVGGGALSKLGSVGKYGGAAAAGGAVGTLMADGSVVRRRRRRKGISAAELRNHRRVEYFLTKNFKCKSGGTRGSHIRKQHH